MTTAGSARFAERVACVYFRYAPEHSQLRCDASDFTLAVPFAEETTLAAFIGGLDFRLNKLMRCSGGGGGGGGGNSNNTSSSSSSSFCSEYVVKSIRLTLPHPITLHNKNNKSRRSRNSSLAAMRSPSKNQKAINADLSSPAVTAGKKAPAPSSSSSAAAAAAVDVPFSISGEIVAAKQNRTTSASPPKKKKPSSSASSPASKLCNILKPSGGYFQGGEEDEDGENNDEGLTSVVADEEENNENDEFDDDDDFEGDEEEAVEEEEEEEGEEFEEEQEEEECDDDDEAQLQTDEEDEDGGSSSRATSIDFVPATQGGGGALVVGQIHNSNMSSLKKNHNSRSKITDDGGILLNTTLQDILLDQLEQHQRERSMVASPAVLNSVALLGPGAAAQHPPPTADSIELEVDFALMQKANGGAGAAEDAAVTADAAAAAVTTTTTTTAGATSTSGNAADHMSDSAAGNNNNGGGELQQQQQQSVLGSYCEYADAGGSLLNLSSASPSSRCQQHHLSSSPQWRRTRLGINDPVSSIIAEISKRERRQVRRILDVDGEYAFSPLELIRWVLPTDGRVARFQIEFQEDNSRRSTYDDEGVPIAATYVQ